MLVFENIHQNSKYLKVKRNKEIEKLFIVCVQLNDIGVLCFQLAVVVEVFSIFKE